MYLSKAGLFALVGGGILFLLTVALFMIDSVLLGQVWLAVAAVFAAAALAWGATKAVSEFNRRTIDSSPREYLPQRKSFTLDHFWAMRLFSIFLKVTAVGLLLIFGWQLFGVLRLRLVGMGSISGTMPGEFFVPNDELINFVVQRVLLIVGVYAGGQLLTLLISVELSLRTLATRRRQNDTPPTSSE